MDCLTASQLASDLSPTFDFLATAILCTLLIGLLAGLGSGLWAGYWRGYADQSSEDN